MNVLVFGASGTIGSAVTDLASKHGAFITTVSNSAKTTDVQTYEGFESLKSQNHKYDACIWAQGVNINDTLMDSDNLKTTLDANLIYIVDSLRYLMKHDLLMPNTRLVIVSSVWQKLIRKKKFSYGISKAALEGLVNSVMADFSSLGFRINAVLPGVIDSKMTRENLSPEQIRKIESETPSQKLVSSEQLAKIILWLASDDSDGINGQFITVDNGWSNVRSI